MSGSPTAASETLPAASLRPLADIGLPYQKSIVRAQTLAQTPLKAGVWVPTCQCGRRYGCARMTNPAASLVEKAGEEGSLVAAVRIFRGQPWFAGWPGGV